MHEPSQLAQLCDAISRPEMQGEPLKRSDYAVLAWVTVLLPLGAVLLWGLL